MSWRLPWRRTVLALASGAAVFAAGTTAVGATPVEEEEARQRLRIEQERREAEADYRQREFECSRRFAVTDCTDRAKAERRAKVDALRREEQLLDAGERRRRAAERLESIRQKTEAQALLRPVPPAAAAEAALPAASKPGPAESGRASTPPAAPDTAAASAGAGEAGARDNDRRARSPRDASRGSTPLARDSGTAGPERAAQVQRRRDAADRQRAEAEQRERRIGPSDKPRAAPLPPRPAIPPASGPR